MDSAQPYYTLPNGMNGEELKKFKRDYSYFIEKAIRTAKEEAAKGFVYCQSATIDIDILPILSDDLGMLKSYMTDESNPHYTVEDWNTMREQAKEFFTAPVIAELDASGYIKKLVR